jgi:hypothetical protein
MRRLQLYWLLYQQDRLSFRRSPALEQSMIAKVLMFIGGAFFVLYLIFFGTMFATVANSGREPGMIGGIMPFMMLVDFFLRFMVQQTPLMLVKPYLLLPVPRHSVIDVFLLSSVFSVYNMLWLCFFLPYCFIVFMGGSGFWLALSLLFIGMSYILINSQFYLMMRTLISRSLLWWVVPIIVYGLYFVSLLIDSKGDVFAEIAEALVWINEQPWWIVVVFVILAVLYISNREMQFRFVSEEVSRQEKNVDKPIHVSNYSFLNRFGQMGEYLKLEMKSIFRNKAIRTRVISSLSLIIILSAINAYTDMYGKAMNVFWCYYCFSLYGVTTLVKIMGPEGNYIDLLLTHRENILKLLYSKYYFHCAILIVPFIIMLPAVIEGKFSILMMFAYMFISSGLLYFLLFQLAIYNKQTLPLDQKMTGKGNIENGIQLVVELVGMFLPIALSTMLSLIFGDTIAFTVILVIGVIFTLLHPLWLRNIYNRMMKRKYENLEGFRASR